MTALYLACGLAMLAALGHSYLSERIFLRPLRRETTDGGVFAAEVPRNLATAMFHLASLCWASMAVSMLLLEPGDRAYQETLQIYAAVFAISGLGNFWALRRPHPGGVLLLSTSLLILASLYA